MLAPLVAAGFTAVLATSSTSPDLQTSRTDRAPLTTAPTVSIRIDALRNDASQELVGPIHVEGETLIRGTVLNGRGSDWVTLVGVREGVWHVLAGTVLLREAQRIDARTVQWEIRTAALGRDQASGFERVKAVLNRTPLPVGRITDAAVWRQSLAESLEVRLSQAPIESHWLRLLTVGSRPADPQALIPVSAQETVTVSSINRPPGTCLQLIVRPLTSSLIWPMPACGTPVGARWSGLIYLGREGYPAGRDFDLFRRFSLTVIDTTKPLPVKMGGITPDEYRAYTPFIHAMSPPVTLVRAVGRCGVQIAITQLGTKDDGSRWFVGPAQRVEGSFIASPDCPSDPTAVVTLLVRQATSATWRVAGLAPIRRHSGYWTVTAADFGPDGEYRVIAVASRRRIAPRAPTPISDMDLAMSDVTAVSEEILFRVVR